MSSEPERIHILKVEDVRGWREFILNGPIYSIGRSSECDIRLSSHYVSRCHATLVQLFNDDGSFLYRIVDGNLKGKPSTNGLLINGHKCNSYDLQDTDEIVFCHEVQAIYYQRGPSQEPLNALHIAQYPLPSSPSQMETETSHERPSL